MKAIIDYIEQIGHGCTYLKDNPVDVIASDELKTIVIIVGENNNAEMTDKIFDEFIFFIEKYDVTFTKKISERALEIKVNE